MKVWIKQLRFSKNMEFKKFESQFIYLTVIRLILDLIMKKKNKFYYFSFLHIS